MNNLDLRRYHYFCRYVDYDDYAIKALIKISIIWQVEHLIQLDAKA